MIIRNNLTVNNNAVIKEKKAIKPEKELIIEDSVSIGNQKTENKKSTVGRIKETLKNAFYSETGETILCLALCGGLTLAGGYGAYLLGGKILASGGALAGGVIGIGIGYGIYPPSHISQDPH